MSTCLELVRQNIPDLSESELGEVLELLRSRQSRLMREGADPSTAAAQSGLEVSESLKAAAAIEKRNALINRRIRLEALDYLNTTWGDNLAEGVLSILYGSSYAREGSRASVNAAQSANFRRYMGGVFGELEAAGLFDVLKRGELDRDGFLETLGGPTVGKLSDAKRLFDAAKSSDDVGAQTLGFAVSNAPGNNLFYTRMAADYLFLYELQEAMSPGYLRRMERRAETERGQQWWLRPSESVR